MAENTLSLLLDEGLVARVRDAEQSSTPLSDQAVVERALVRYLSETAIREARAINGTLDEEAANRLAVEELRAMRRERDAA